MDKVMSWLEIEAAFDSEWVLIEDPELTNSLKVIQGKVVFHSKEQSEVYEKMRDLPRLNHAIRYIGRLPEGWEMAL